VKEASGVVVGLLPVSCTRRWRYRDTWNETAERLFLEYFTSLDEIAAVSCTYNDGQIVIT